MNELNELVLRYRELYDEFQKLKNQYPWCIGSLTYPEPIVHVTRDFFLKNVSSFSVCSRQDNYYPYELYIMIEGIRVICLAEELPKGCEL